MCDKKGRCRVLGCTGTTKMMSGEELLFGVSRREKSHYIIMVYNSW